MDRRSWLWRRKSSEKSPGETESSGSVSSHSERYSDDQEASRASPISTSPNHAQSPDNSYKVASYEVHDATKSLNDKLSAALLSIGAKEDLVKQHAKVAEEAVAGWEKAENEVAALKQQLEATAQKNSALEDRIGHLDGALKECVRQLRQSREEQEKKLHVALIKKTNEWESNKFELETCLTELQAQLEARNAEATTSIDHNLRLKLKALEKENLALRTELLVQSEDLQMKTLERELSTRAAETASKQHLESIKKVSRLETECRRLRAAARKSSPSNDHKPFPNLVCVESITDCQSDSGEQLFGVDNEPSCSDSWASALIAELDQFKNDQVLTRNLTASSIEIDLMDDFLEMERLAALPEADHGNSSFELDADSDHAITRENPLKAELEALRQKMGELEEKVERMAIERGEVEMVLAETRNQLKISRDQLIITEDKLVELQWQLNSANGSKHVFKMEVEAIESRRKELGSLLESANLEVEKLREKVGLLEKKSAEFAAKCQNIEVMEAKRKELEDQFESAHLEMEKLREKVGFLEGKLEEERTLSAKFAAKCRNMEAIEVERKALESQFMSAHMEAEELRAKMSLLEGKLIEERALSVEFTAKVEALEANRKALNSQLGSANLEAGKLREKMGLLEKEVEVERALSSELAAKCRNLQAMETKREELESQLSLAHLEAGELCKKVSLLEGKVEEERALQSQLEWAHLEVGRLCEKVGLLEKEVEEERALSAELGAKCQSLEDELVRKRREVEFRQPVSSNAELKIKQERELAVAAGKLAACQKSIASLSQQLKSLATFEDFMVEAEKPELDDKENLSGSSTLQNCDGRGVTPTSPSSSLPRFVKLLSPSWSFSHVKNQ